MRLLLFWVANENGSILWMRPTECFWIVSENLLSTKKAGPLIVILIVILILMKFEIDPVDSVGSKLQSWSFIVGSAESELLLHRQRRKAIPGTWRLLCERLPSLAIALISNCRDLKKEQLIEQTTVSMELEFCITESVTSN